ncbi:MAG: PH domain-containing protein [Polyangiales bacterium]
MRTFRPPERLTSARRAVSVVLLPLVAGPILASTAAAPPGARIVIGGATALMMVVMGFILALSWLGPSRMTYTVGVGKLRIETLFSKQEWPLASLHARRYSPSGIWRVGGTALPGYFTGRYRADGEGIRMFATDTSHGVLIIGKDRLFVTPSDEAAFLEALRTGGAQVDEAHARPI